MIVKINTEDFPEYATPGSAGFDLECKDTISNLQPGEIRVVGTGIKVELPEGYCMLILPRSGLAVKGITVINSPGLVDSDYRGEIKVALINHSKYLRTIAAGSRIAQAMVVPFEQVTWSYSHKLSETERGEGGFGSTKGVDYE